MFEDRAEETEASYPDSSLVRDSREGGSNESEEVEDCVGEGGLKLQTGAPLPKHLGHVIWSPGGLSISMVTVTKSLTVHPWSLSWALVHLGHYLQCGPPTLPRQIPINV